MKNENTIYTLNIAASKNPADHALPMLCRREGYWLGSFHAMASPCELLMSGESVDTAMTLVKMAAEEAWRIEYKFSRYVEGNIIDQINKSNGKPVEVDAETARLLDYAQQCYELSDGAFDISSGLFRQVWRFDGSDKIPSQSEIDPLLNKVGWHLVNWQRPILTLKPGMELDFGGIGKEYAVDRTLILLQHHLKNQTEDSEAAILVNFGGDLNCSGPQKTGTPWKIGVESTGEKTSENEADLSLGLHPQPLILELQQGALATSGDSRRFLLKEGVRYSHIINPKTGWPVSNAPRSVTVAASTCTQAGVLATFALLQGENAEQYLKQQGIRFWVQR